MRLSQRTMANYIKNTNPPAVRTLQRTRFVMLSRGQTQGQSWRRITSLCMVFTCVGLMDRASSYQRLASSMLPLSSAICPLMYSTLWDVGKRLAASCVQAAASAGFDMLVYTSAVREDRWQMWVLNCECSKIPFTLLECGTRSSFQQQYLCQLNW